jgi:hypothetical protein
MLQLLGLAVLIWFLWALGVFEGIVFVVVTVYGCAVLVVDWLREKLGGGSAVNSGV